MKNHRLVTIGVLTALFIAIWFVSFKPNDSQELVIRPFIEEAPASYQDISKPEVIKEPDPDIDEVSDSEPIAEISDELFVELTASEKLTKTLEELAERIEKDGKPLHHAIVGADPAYFVIRQEMRLALEEDPSLVYELMDMFAADPDSLLSREISAVLSETGLPEVQSAALDIGLNQYQYSNEDRAAALFVVANMDTIDGATRDRLLDSYSYEEDSELLQFSLIALKPAPSTAEDYARVNESLTDLTASDDEHVRRHSVYQMAEWATSNEQLTEVRSLALNDPDINTRSRAIMSIAESSIQSSENKATLVSVINNPSELAIVRQYALDGLNAYPLTSAEIYEYQALSEELSYAIEAEIYN